MGSRWCCKRTSRRKFWWSINRTN